MVDGLLCAYENSQIQAIGPWHHTQFRSPGRNLALTIDELALRIKTAVKYHNSQNEILRLKQWGLL
jgi:hypothetical protein